MSSSVADDNFMDEELEMEEVDDMVKQVNGRKLGYLYKKVSAKFLNELGDDVQAIANRAKICCGKASSAGQELQMQNRFEGVIENGIALPPGMNGYCTTLKKFVKYFALQDGPTKSKKVGEFTLSPSTRGMWAMQVSDSEKFNTEHAENARLCLKRERKVKPKPAASDNNA